ncbi:MAG: citryl-CoA lyase [Acidobacteria bacterium RIFCSPLOWO2_12_FULL_67_14b]|nr:MAG: citryl-CoA lyase [Acidobacteria bacterium RIFCSPLOWO2_12_FULL_67_14b]
MEPWRTAIVESGDGQIRIRGYDVTSLMTGRTFTDTIYLLHRGRLPTARERSLLDAILTGVADHGPGAPSCAAARLAVSGNRQSVSSAMAAGILAVGDEHGGAGSGCMEMIAGGLERVTRQSMSIPDCARQVVAEIRATGRRVPGLGHRVHRRDPRTPVLFELARRNGLAGNGIAFMEALEAVVRDTIKPLPINIDGALAAVLHDMGFAPVFGRLLFIIGRAAGLSAEIVEELERERPMRIRIPVAYDGEPPRSLGQD